MTKLKIKKKHSSGAGAILAVTFLAIAPVVEPQLLAAIPGLAQIRALLGPESDPEPVTIAADDARLDEAIAPVTLDEYDALTDDGRVAWDFFYSGDDGVLDPNGAYLTIQAATMGETEAELAGVEFTFDDGTVVLADELAQSVVPPAVESGLGAIVDADPESYASLGSSNDGNVPSVTVGLDELPDAAAVPEPTSAVMLTGAGLLLLRRRRRNADA